MVNTKNRILPSDFGLIDVKTYSCDDLKWYKFSKTFFKIY